MKLSKSEKCFIAIEVVGVFLVLIALFAFGENTIVFEISEKVFYGLMFGAVAAAIYAFSRLPKPETRKERQELEQWLTAEGFRPYPGSVIVENVVSTVLYGKGDLSQEEDKPVTFIFVDPGGRKELVVPMGQLNERNRYRYGDYGRFRVVHFYLHDDLLVYERS